MATTRLSSKGQVIIPKAFRSTHRWEAGTEFLVIDTGDGILLRPKAPFVRSALADVAGMLKGKIQPKTDVRIKAALDQDLRRKWRGRD